MRARYDSKGALQRVANGWVRRTDFFEQSRFVSRRGFHPDCPNLETSSLMSVNPQPATPSAGESSMKSKAAQSAKANGQPNGKTNGHANGNELKAAGQARVGGRLAADIEALDKKQLLAALSAFKKGDFTVRLPEHLIGIDGKIADAFNTVVELNERM